MSGYECRWGGPETDACWNVGACGCLPTAVEEVWREAHAEHVRVLLWGIFDAMSEAARLPSVAAWLNRRITR